MRFDHILMGFLLVAGFTIGGVLMINDINDNYEGVNMSDDDFDNVTSLVDELFNITQQAKEKTVDTEVSGEGESWESMTKGSYSGVRLIKGSFKLFSGLTFSISNKLGIRSEFVIIAFIAFVLTITFGIIYMIFRFIPN